MTGYMVPPVWLEPSDLRYAQSTVHSSVFPGRLTRAELYTALHKEHQKIHRGEWTSGSVHFPGEDVCVPCGTLWPCATMMLISHACRVEWSKLWTPNKPVPTAREVASWPVS